MHPRKSQERLWNRARATSSWPRGSTRVRAYDDVVTELARPGYASPRSLLETTFPPFVLYASLIVVSENVDTTAPDKNVKNVPSQRVILDALRRSVSPPPVSLTYRLGLLVAGWTMVLLPLLYLCLVALPVYGVYVHVIHNRGLAGSGIFASILYFSVVPIGGIIVFFLIKPVFAEASRRQHAHRLDRRDQRFLFAYIETLCRTLKAPAPAHIEVDVLINASAGLHLDMVTRTRHGAVLTIGLPLVSGMSLRELTGVLSHEFGHFRQGSGMRMNQRIHSIQTWFARAVYERDEWDERLVEWSEDESWFALIAQLGRLGVWLSRQFLWVLMVLGNIISALFVRQMEHDADRYEVLISGSDVFEKTAMRLRVLSVASDVTYEELAETYQEGRLGNNLPKLIASKADSFTDEESKTIRDAVLSQSTGLFDSHPSDSERNRRAREVSEAGIFRLDVPANVLFDDFDELCRRVTLGFYRRQLGEIPSASLVSTEDFRGTQDEERLGQEALARYVQGLLSPSRMLRFEMPDLSMARRPKESLMALMTARMQVEEMLPKAKTGYEQLGRAFEMQENVWFARCLLSAGILPDARSFRLPSADQRGVERLEERAALIVAAQLPFIEAWERNLRRRMTAALECLHHPKLFAQGEEHDAMVARAQELATAQRELQKNLDDVLELRRHLSALELLGAQLSDENHQELIDQLGLMQNQAHEHLVASRDGLIYARHPFAGGDEEITIGMYLIERLPERRLALGPALFEVDAQLMTEVYEAGQIVGERYYSLYLRVIGALAAIAEKVESKAGLPPLPKVEPTED